MKKYLVRCTIVEEFEIEANTKADAISEADDEMAGILSGACALDYLVSSIASSVKAKVIE